MGQIISNNFKKYSIIFIILILLFLPFTTTILKVESSSTTFTPKIIESSVNPAKAKPGDILTVSVSIEDLFVINRVEARFSHELGFDVVNLSLVSGTKYRGIWEGEWVVHDTIIKEYLATIIAYSSSGNFSFLNLSWYDPEEWWNINWSYRKQANISNPFTGYQMKIIIGYNSSVSGVDVHLNGHCKSDFSDIRFVNNLTELSYWVENKIDGEKAEIWVKTNSNNYFFIYYGSPSANSQSNGDTTFDFFDDFSGSSLNTSKWDQMNSGTGTITISSGNITIASTGDWSGTSDSARAIVSKTSFSYNFISEAYVVNYGIDTWNKFFGLRSGAAVNQRFFVLQINNNGSRITNGYRINPNGNTFWYGENSGIVNPGNNKIAKFEKIGNTVNSYYNGSLTNSINNITNLIYVSLTDTNGIANATKFDWIRVRRYASPEPQWSSFGVEEVYLTTPTKPVLLSPQNNSYTNDSTPTFQWENSENHENYTLYVNNTSDFTNPHINISLSPSTNNYTTPDGKALPEGKWYWKIVANNSQKSNSSDIWNFIYEATAPTKPVLLSPQNNSYTNDSTPTFQWENSENHENYTLYVNNTSDFTNPHLNISLSPSTNNYTTPDGNALPEGKWYWKVVVNNYTSQKSNSSDIWSFIVDKTSPNQVNLSSPKDKNISDNNNVVFCWDPTNDNTTNTSEVSNIKWYQLQVDTNSDFSSTLVNENTSNNATFSLTKTIAGKLYWHVRAWDNAGNQGNWSETWNLTIFSYSLTSESSMIQIKRGGAESTILSVNRNFGDDEYISLNGSWIGENQPNSIKVNFSTNKSLVPFVSIVTFTCEENSSTGTFIYMINATSESGINRSLNIEIIVYSMLFSIDVFPRSLSLIRNDQGTATISVNFDQGILSGVNLTGNWIDDTPSGVSIELNPSSGTPNFDSTIKFTTSTSATAGSFVYRVTGTSSGLTKIANIYLDILKDMSITITTDKQIYEKGQNIKISGTAKDPKGNLVNSGTAIINLSARNWSHTITTSIANGIYNTSYYITFDKPVGKWNISVTATDTNGHETLSPQTTSISVESPEIYEQYSVNVLSPTTGQVFKRGDIITFTISLINIENEKVQGAEVKAYLESNEIIVFSEVSPGIYSCSYELGYDFMLGDNKIYVEGKKYEDEKLKVGFNFLDFKVSTITFTIKVVEIKPGDLIEVGETVSIKLEALYPNGDPVENGIIKATGLNGIELLFSKNKSEGGMYTANYIPTEGDIGNWIINVNAEDAYGNYYKGEIINIEIVNIKILSYILKFWWITALGLIIMISFIGYVGNKKLYKIKIRKLKDEILQFKKLKEKNAIFYYSDYSINRETYDHLSQLYESKIVDLSKKLSILEKKFEKKNGKKK